MSDVKTKPKTREKPTTAAHAIKNAPKTLKSVPYNVLRNAPSVMKEQLVKQTSEKLSKVQQDGQTAQTPENYATDTIEDTAYSAASKVYRTTQNIAERKLKSYKAQKAKRKENYKEPNTPTALNTTDSTPKFADNQPKTTHLTDRKISHNSDTIKPQSNDAPKTVSRTPKTADNMKIPSELGRSNANQEIIPKSGIITPKTKEAYTTAQKNNAPKTVSKTPKTADNALKTVSRTPKAAENMKLLSDLNRSNTTKKLFLTRE